MPDSKTTKDRKEEKESYKLRQENLALKKDLIDLILKHNNILDALSKLGLNLQIVCNQNKFRASKP